MRNLIEYLQKEDAIILINDINKDKVEEINKKYNVGVLNDLDMFGEKNRYLLSMRFRCYIK